MKMKNEKRTVFRFPFFYENEKRMKVVRYLNFVFFIEVKAKSKYRILNFVFQFIKNTKWQFGFTDFLVFINRLLISSFKILDKEFYGVVD